jgi:hypothetical protein
MAISFNTGAKNSANTASSVTLAIPAGVNVGDVMIMALEVFIETSTAPTISFSGAGGNWTLVPMTTGTNPEVATAGTVVWSFGYAYYRVATAGDQGATLTITESGSPAGATWMAVTMAAYTGASTSSPIDVAFGNNGQGTVSSQTPPSGATGAAGDWAVYLCCAGINAGTLGGGPGTNRESVTSSVSIAARSNDSNGSVGGAGTTIGGGSSFTQAGSTANWWSLFTIGLAPPGAAAAEPVPYLSQYSGMF